MAPESEPAALRYRSSVPLLDPASGSSVPLLGPTAGSSVPQRESVDWDFPTDVLIESDDVPLEGLSYAVERLVSGELPAKVMIAPSRGNGDTR